MKLRSVYARKPFCLAVMVMLLIGNSCKKQAFDRTIQRVQLESGFGSDFTLQIALPSNYRDSESYGLLFLLDAEWMMKEVLEALEKTNVATKWIVVGLGYSGSNNRSSDFTPTASTPGSSKASLLAAFIEAGIINNYLNQQFPNLGITQENRIFVGHSLGGLFGTYLFLKKQELFGKYLLISSSYMTDSQSIFGVEQTERSAIRFQSARIFFATGALEEGGFHSSLQHFSQVLTRYYPNVLYRSEVIRNAGHTGVLQPALQQGLSYLLH